MIDIDDDVLRLAEAMAKAESTTTDRLISDLILRALAPAPSPARVISFCETAGWF